MAMDYQEMGRRMANRRRTLNLKQSQVSERCGVNDNYISNIERAVSIPSLDVFLRLCEALETTPDAVLLGTSLCTGEEERRRVSAQIRGLTAPQLRLVERFIQWVREEV